MIDHKSWRRLQNGERQVQVGTVNSVQDRFRHASIVSETLINPADAALLLLNHQLGQFKQVKDISIDELRANTAMLAKLAALMDLPLISSALAPDGTNGPLIPEIHQFAPQAMHVPRKTEINAWDNDQFVETVHRTGRKTLIMAGVWTSVSLMFPALEAKAAGFKVYAVTDASGDPSDMVSRSSLARLSQAGIVPTSALAILCELHRSWNEGEGAALAKSHAGAADNLAVKETPILEWQAARLHY